MEPSGNRTPEGKDMIHHLAKKAERYAGTSQASTPVVVVTQSQTSVGVPKKRIYVVPMPRRAPKEPQIQIRTPTVDATQTRTPVPSTKRIFIVSQPFSAGGSTQTQVPGTRKHIYVLAQPQNAAGVRTQPQTTARITTQPQTTARITIQPQTIAGKIDPLKVPGQSQIKTPTGVTVQSQIVASVKAQIQPAVGRTDPPNAPRQTRKMVHFQPKPLIARDAAPTKADAQTQTATVVAEVVSMLQHGDVRPAPQPYLVHKEEVLRRMGAPEKMSVRTLLMYTGKNPADRDSKNRLVKNLIKAGIPPVEIPAYITSAFSRLTEGDTTMLCSDMKSLAIKHLNFTKMAEQLIEETNPVQHWSKIIDTKAQLEEMRLCFRDPANSRLMDNVTHGMSTGVMDATFDIISTLIDYQVQLIACLVNTMPSHQTPTRTAVKTRPSPALQTSMSLVTPPVITNPTPLGPFAAQPPLKSLYVIAQPHNNGTQTQPLRCCQETQNETQTDTQLPKEPLKHQKGRGVQRGPRGSYRKRAASGASDRKQEAAQEKGKGKKVKLNPSPHVATDTREEGNAKMAKKRTPGNTEGNSAAGCTQTN
ncbi:uncharacterized protein LOC109865800 [Oncorhynchus kisutch]|uniref:uncharacterized protein LOC109865800 n=1 Tax=Oncorhynchus kisutch TaxID=8019 RepID=UPI0009A09CE3|nr:uncharacterized protein LOC109865800 [Oncorhynchus kisutch]